MERKKEYDQRNIKFIRKFHKLTQENFAKEFSITRDILAKYETNVAKVPFELADSISMHYKYDVNDFYDKIFDTKTGKFLSPESSNIVEEEEVKYLNKYELQIKELREMLDDKRKIIAMLEEQIKQQKK